MATPCVLYVQHVEFEDRNRKMVMINGATSRRERIIARVTQWDASCPVNVSLTIDDVEFDAPNDLGHVVQACEWVTRQVASLGYFVDVKPY